MLRTFERRCGDSRVTVLKRFEDLSREWRDSAYPPEFKGANDGGFMIKFTDVGFNFIYNPSNCNWNGRSSLRAKCRIEESDGQTGLSGSIGYLPMPTWIPAFAITAIFFLSIYFFAPDGPGTRAAESERMRSGAVVLICYYAYLALAGAPRSASDAEAVERLISRVFLGEG